MTTTAPAVTSVRLVAGLPAPQRITSPACLIEPVGMEGRRLRQLRLATRRTGCCDFHAGDWRRACEAAVLAFDLGSGSASNALALLGELGLTGWEQEAAESLFLEPIMLCGSDYANGARRVQAMKDAGVIRTVLAG